MTGEADTPVSWEGTGTGGWALGRGEDATRGVLMSGPGYGVYLAESMRSFPAPRGVGGRVLEADPPGVSFTEGYLNIEMGVWEPSCQAQGRT